LRNSVLLGLAIILSSCSDPPGDERPPPRGDLPIEPRFEALADKIEAERVATGTPGVAALLIEGDEVVFAHGFGSRHPTSDEYEPVTAATLFRIGSVTKMLTATAFLQLVASGDITVDAPVTDVIPEFAGLIPEGTPDMSMEHVLTHSSGVVDYLEIDAPPGEQTDAALDSVLTGRLAQDGYLMSPPGRMWNYANPNYYILGLAVERLVGQPYVQVMEERVFGPLGMERTLFRPEEVMEDGDFAWGKTAYVPSGVVAPDSYENPWGRPAGYAFSSVWDLSEFALFLMHGQEDVLPSDLRESMQQPRRNTELFYDLEHYGYGLLVSDAVATGSGYYETRIVSHGGDIPGFAASVYMHPESGLAFITLANADGAHFNASAAFALENFATFPEPVEPPAPDASLEHLASLAGTFHDPFNVGAIIVAAGESGLTVELPDVDAAGLPYERQLRQVSDRTFVLSIQGTSIAATFILDDNGNVEYFRTRAFVGRVAEVAPAARVLVDGEALSRRLRTLPPPSLSPVPAR
jgi:CubicO group peptidase (beta-lactamase class C family)